ncbi:hypothetical protein [Parabacteroides johnsonii]|uniref:hypothetical protein n=1 Tax=Parabacteroides johnsonii TaxID=387661 RepID=UPI0011DE20DC|nr:hypothetical protein [Parabacteroides johnsonii]MBP3642512.1 hypothetical protein [Parabacteroides sp.]
MARIQTFPKSRLKLTELQAAGHAIETRILSELADMTQFKAQFDEFQESLSQKLFNRTYSFDRS